jgi:hypothetical protein
VQKECCLRFLSDTFPIPEAVSFWSDNVIVTMIRLYLLIHVEVSKDVNIVDELVGRTGPQGCCRTLAVVVA